MPSLTSSPVWPTTLSRREAPKIKRLLAREGLELGSLIYSVSGTNDLIILIHGWAYDDEDDYLFDVLWEFDEKRISHSTDQYRLKSLEIIDDIN